MPSPPPSARKSPCAGPPPVREVTLITPAIAFEPYNDEPDPRITSICSVSTVVRFERNPVASPCGLAASRKRMPSISTAVSWLRRPRVWMVVRLPGPPSDCTRMPGSVRSASATDSSLRSAISSASITSSAFATSWRISGVLDAVTTTSTVMPETASVTSRLRAPSTLTTVAPDREPPEPCASITYSPAGIPANA